MGYERYSFSNFKLRKYQGNMALKENIINKKL